MSALPPKADIGTQLWNVRFVPKAEVASRSRSIRGGDPFGAIVRGPADSGLRTRTAEENLMPFIDGRTIPEVLMRPGIHGRFLAHKELGASTVSLLMNRADPGAAVPLHMH